MQLTGIIERTFLQGSGEVVSFELKDPETLEQHPILLLGSARPGLIEEGQAVTTRCNANRFGIPYAQEIYNLSARIELERAYDSEAKRCRWEPRNYTNESSQKS